MKSFTQKAYFYPLAFFLAALALRLIYFWEIRSDPLTNLPILDAAYYEKWAKAILAGTPFTSTAYFVEPGYAYMLAVFHRIFGASLTPIIFFQFLLSSATVALIYMVTERLFRKTADPKVEPLEISKGSTLGWNFGHWAGVVAAGLMLLLRPLLFYDGLLLKTSVEVFLITLILYVGTQFIVSKNVGEQEGAINRAPTRQGWRFFFLGLLFGLTAIIKANIFYTVPLVILVIIFQNIKLWKNNIVVSLFFLLGVIVPILPVTIHNWNVSHSIVPINYSGGPNLYIGNWEGSDGSMKPPEFISMSPESEETSWVKMAKAYLGPDISPAQVSSYWTGRAISSALADKSFFLENSGKKILLLFNAVPLDDNYSIEYALDKFTLLGVLWPFWALAVLGLAGMILYIINHFSLDFDFIRNKKLFSRVNKVIAIRQSAEKQSRSSSDNLNSTGLPRRSEDGPPRNDKKEKKGVASVSFFYAIFFGYALTLVVAHVAERYRLALAPIFAIFAGYFLVWMGGEINYAKKQLSQKSFDLKKYKKFGIAGAIFLVLIVLSLRNLGNISRTMPADTWNNLGSVVLEKGQLSTAEKYFRLSIYAEPMLPAAHANLGKTYLEEGKLDDALAELRHALKFQPDANADLLKIAYEAKRDNTPLEEIKNRIAELKNADQTQELFDPDYISAMKLLRMQKYAEALALLEKVQEKYPDNDQVLSNIGICYKNTGNLDRAKENLALAIINNGYNLPARYNMVNVLRKRKENDLAFTQLSIINSIAPGFMLSQLQLAELQLAKGNVAAAKSLYQAFANDPDNAMANPDQIPKAKEMIARLTE